SVNKRFTDRNQEARKDGNVTAELLLDYDVNPQAGPARFALEHGLIKEFQNVMKEVGQLDPNNPKFKAFQKIEAAMAKPITKADASAGWKQRLGLRESRTSKEFGDHFVLLYSPSASETEVTSRLKALQDSYRAF